MSITIGGLASGIDTDGLTAALVAAASRKGDLLVAQKAAVTSRSGAYTTLSARLTALSEALAAIDEVEEFRGVSATSSDEDSVEVSVEGDAVIGRYAVQVNQLAESSLIVSDGFSDQESSGVIAEGTLSITVGGTTTEVTVDSSTSSLEDLVAAINDQVDGVTAYIMDTGDSSNPYRLVIAGDDTGADNAVSIDTSGLTGSGTVPSFSEVTAAADAEVEINGVTVTDSDNELDAAVQGVTFSLNNTTTSAATVRVSKDLDAMVDAVNSVITAWNSVVSHIETQRVFDVDEGLRGAYIGESLPTTITQQLQSTVAATYGSGAIEALSQVGISTNQDGELELDEDAFRAALAADFDGVVSLFTDESDGVAKALQETIDVFTDDEDGTVTSRLESLADLSEVYQERIDQFYEQMDAYEARLKEGFTQMEIIMSRMDAAMTVLENFTKASLASSS